MEAKTIEELSELGYSQGQINQIIMGYKDNNPYIDKLKPSVSINNFRDFKKYYKNNSNITPGLWNILIDKMNEEKFNISKIADSKHEDALFALRLFMYDDVTYEKLYEKKEPTKEMIFIVRSFMEDNVDLIDYKNYGLEELKFLKEAMSTVGIKIDIKDKLFNEEQLKFLLYDMRPENVCDEMLNPEYTIQKMELVYEFKKNGLDSSYIDKYSEKEVDCYLTLLDDDIDISEYYKNSYNDIEARIVEDCALRKLDPNFLLNYIGKLDDTLFYNIWQLYIAKVTKKSIEKFIEMADELKMNDSYIDIYNLVINRFGNRHLDCDKEYDITPLLVCGFNFSQRQVIASAIFAGVDPKKFAIKEMSSSKMKFLLDKMLNEYFIDNACDPKYSIDEMAAIIYYNTKGVFYDTIDDYKKDYIKDKNQDFEAFCKIYKEYGRNSVFTDNFAIINSLVSINKEREYKIDIEQVMSTGYVDIQELFADIEYNLDVNLIWRRDISREKRHELRKWLIDGLDIKDIEISELTPSDLANMRNSIMRETLDEKISKYSDEKESLFESSPLKDDR